MPTAKEPDARAAPVLAKLKLKAEHLLRLFQVNSFPVPRDGRIFFGLRGSLPVDASSQRFSTEQSLFLTTPDYASPRCTLGQLMDGKIALFPGSTVPHLQYIQ